MWRVERYVAKVGCLVRRGLLDKATRCVGNQVGGVSLLVGRLKSDVPVPLSLACQIEVVDRPVVVPFELGKTARQGMPFSMVMPQMPLAENPPLLITGLGQ